MENNIDNYRENWYYLDIKKEQIKRKGGESIGNITRIFILF